LPLRSVPVAKEGGKVVVNEHPSTTGLASWKRAAFGAAAHLLGVHLEKGRSFGERQGLHSAMESTKVRRPWSHYRKRRPETSLKAR
jgi:hypothetical protein